MCTIIVCRRPCQKCVPRLRLHATDELTSHSLHLLTHIVAFAPNNSTIFRWYLTCRIFFTCVRGWGWPSRMGIIGYRKKTCLRFQRARSSCTGCSLYYYTVKRFIIRDLFLLFFFVYSFPQLADSSPQLFHIRILQLTIIETPGRKTISIRFAV